MRSFYKSVDVEIDDWDVKDYLDDLSDKDLEHMGYYRALSADDIGTAPYKFIEEFKQTVQELKKQVQFVPYSHEAILFERLVRLAENAKA